MTINIFHHEDRIVDQQPDRHDHRQQGQQIDRVTHQLHIKQYADDRQRNRYQWYQGRAERAQKQEDDDDDDDRGLRQGDDDFIDRGLDEFGRVVGDGRIQSWRKRAFHFLELGAYQLYRGQRITVGSAVNADVNRRHIVEHDE